MNRLLIISMLLLCTETLLAADLSAPTHYTQNCIACHARITGGDGSVIYNSKNGLVKTLKALRKRVHYCRTSLTLRWSKSEEAQVVNYLDWAFYRFNQSSQIKLK